MVVNMHSVNYYCYVLFPNNFMEPLYYKSWYNQSMLWHCCRVFMFHALVLGIIACILNLVANNYAGEGVTIDILMSESVENIVVDLLKLYPVRTIWVGICENTLLEIGENIWNCNHFEFFCCISLNCRNLPCFTVVRYQLSP